MRFACSAILTIVASSAIAQTVVLQPKAFDEAEVAIRVVSFVEKPKGSTVSIEVVNRTDSAKNLQIECNTFAAYNAQVGNDAAYIDRVPANSVIAYDIPTRRTEVERVQCRIADMLNAR